MLEPPIGERNRKKATGENTEKKNDNIKTKLKISDDQANIDKYRLAANLTEYHIISKLILQ